MDIQSKITDTVEAFDISTPLETLQRFFKRTAYSHVAIIQDDKFLGVLAEEDFGNFGPEESLEDHRAALEIFFAIREASWLDVLKIFTANQANLIPVLDNNGVVLGYYDLLDILDFIVETPFFHEPGGLLVEGAAETGTDRIELYTESYAVGYAQGNKNAVKPFTEAARLAHELGLGVNAGHDLNLENIAHFQSEVPHLKEVSIGHALISEALYLGLETTIQKYLEHLLS